jgi:hypothetical protein
VEWTPTITASALPDAVAAREIEVIVDPFSR